MTTVAGYIYLVTHDSRVTVNVTLNHDERTASHAALLIATLYRSGYSPQQTGNAIVFQLSGPEVRRGGVGRAFDAIGRALGGSSYRLSFEKYQENSGNQGNVWCERFSFRADGSTAERYESEDIDCG